ncbi:MAG: SRPBCC family protein [Ferruginibacter sp.]
MKILKTLLFVILGLLALVLILALFLKKDYAVVREITINKPRQQVFDYIKFLKNQDNYSKWATMDSNMKKEYRGVDGTVGFVSAWDSKLDDVGKGEQEIKKINEGQKMDFELRFIKPFEAKDDAYMITETAGNNQTKVKWGFNGRMNYPTNLFLLFMNMDKMLGKDLEVGLLNLKNILEKQ